MNFGVCSAYAFLASECSIFRSSTEAVILDSRDKGNLKQRNNSPPKKDERRLIRRAASGYQVL